MGVSERRINQYYSEGCNLVLNGSVIPGRSLTLLQNLMIHERTENSGVV